MSLEKSAWVTSKIKTEDGHPVQVRVRTKLHPFVNDGRYIDRFEVRWRYDADPKTLFPGQEKETKLMDTVEKAMLVEMEEDGWCVLAGVVTGHNHRVWHFYTVDPEQAEERFNIALENFDLLPIEILSEADSGWEEYKYMLAFGGWPY